MKQSHAYKGHASSYNVNTLNLLVLNYSLQTVNLQLEVNQCDNVSYKKIEIMMQQNISPFILTQK